MVLRVCSLDWESNALTTRKNAGKFQLVLSDWSNNTVAIAVKMDVFAVEEK